MSRIRTLVSIVLPSMLAGGLIFGSTFGHASAGRDNMLAFWPATGDALAPRVAQAGSASKRPSSPLPPPAPPPPPTARPPLPPKPPKAPKAGGGVSVSIKNGTVQLAGIKDMVLGQLASARAAIQHNTQIPKDVRAKIVARLDKVRATVKRRMSKISLGDLDQLEDEMEKMGEEIEEAMEGLDDDLDKLGDKLKRDLGAQLGKDLAKNFGDMDFDFDFDDMDFDFDFDHHTMSPGVDIDDDDDDMKEAISDLKDLALEPAQRDAITKLRTSSDRSVATAKTKLDDLSRKLEAALANPATTDTEIARYVDQISAQEAAIRKARLLAWAQARRVLDDRQRQKIQGAAKKKTK